MLAVRDTIGVVALKKTAVCPHCAQPRFFSRKTCGAPECQRLQRNVRMRDYLRKRRAECRARGESYDLQGLTPEQRAVRLHAFAEILDELNLADPCRTARRRQELHLRRQEQKRHEGAETFSSQEIFERDSWACGICGMTVDKHLEYPHPMSKTLDHIIPLGLNGPHTRENAQLAHLTCNVEKRCRIQ